MQEIFAFIFKALRKLQYFIIPLFTSIVSKIYLWLNGVQFKAVKSYGIPHVHVSLHGKFHIGDSFVMNNTIESCESGYNGRCRIEVFNGARLILGDSVGMSAATITCMESITIGNHVMLGVGVHIYDTDFHSLNPEFRKVPKLDFENKKTKPVLIKDSVFLGAHVIVLKGVTIGENSIVGAGSVLTSDIPPNQIWAGNPARFVRNID